jgi:iron complex transport system substrate-binding protein
VAAREKSLILVAALSVLVACGTSPGGAPAQTDEVRVARRVISLVPALTEMLFAIGAGPQVIAVSSFDNYPPETEALPRVGALLDPDVERILALRPDLVITYGSQGSVEAQLASAGIRTFSYRHGGIETMFETMRELGAATGHTASAVNNVIELEAQLDAVKAKVRDRSRPRTLLVFGRQPGSLQQLYVSGGTGFLHEMLEAAGGVNVFADVPRESVQPSQETLITRAPDVILEVSPTRRMSGMDAAQERAVWSPLASLPAVKTGRIHFLYGDYLVVPGPRVGLATETFARTLHPDAFQ